MSQVFEKEGKILWLKILGKCDSEGEELKQFPEWLSVIICKGKIFDRDDYCRYHFDGDGLCHEDGSSFAITDQAVSRIKSALNEA